MSKHIVRFVKFGFASGIATLLDLFLLWVFVEFIGIYYLVSAIIAFLGGSSLNYGINKVWAFRGSKVGNVRGLMSFIIIGWIGLVWTILLMALFVEFGGIHYLIARLLAAVLVLGWNYGMNSIVTFR